MTRKVNYTYITQLKLQKKIKTKLILLITMPYIDIMAMCCRVISPFFIFAILVV